MKRLLLMRHAQAERSSASGRDFDRALSVRGQRDAPSMGRELKRRGFAPDTILASGAARAWMTAEEVARSSAAPPPVLAESLYAACASTLIAAARGLPESAVTAMIVAHNPGISEAVCHLTGDDAGLRTAAVAAIEIDIERWSDLKGAGRLLWLLDPKGMAEG